MDQGQIELLSVDLLNEERVLVEQMRLISKDLEIGLGWHYLLDLPWAGKNISIQPGMKVLDAGAGAGVLQWWLAGQCVDVISVDRNSRYHLPDRCLEEYRVRGWRKEDLAFPLGLHDIFPSPRPNRWSQYPQKLMTATRKVKRQFYSTDDSATVFIYNQDLLSMPDIPDNYVDKMFYIGLSYHCLN